MRIESIRGQHGDPDSGLDKTTAQTVNQTRNATIGPRRIKIRDNVEDVKRALTQGGMTFRITIADENGADEQGPARARAPVDSAKSEIP